MLFSFLFFSYSRVFDIFELSTLDLRYKLRPPVKALDEIVIIEVGDDSIAKIGKWPFARSYHALLVKALRSAGAKEVIFDIFFSEEKEGDRKFADAIRDSGDVYLPYVFDLQRDLCRGGKVLCPTGYVAELIDVLASEAKGTGFINVEPDIDGKIRKIPPVMMYEGALYSHITVLAAINSLGYDFSDVKLYPGKSLKVGPRLTIPLDEDSSMLVNYPAVWGKAFRHYSYVDIIQSYLSDVMDQDPVMDLEELKGAVCFIGLTATASPDSHPSPLESIYPGVGVHASVYNSISQGFFLRRLNRWWNMLVLLLVWLFTGLITWNSQKRYALVSIFLITVCYSMFAIALFMVWGIWVDVFYPLTTMAGLYIFLTFNKYVAETQKREHMEKELNIAKEIQRSFLPSNIPTVGGLDVAVEMRTARQVGGDLYDIVQLDDNSLGIMVGDVSGKGVPASLYMAKAVSVFNMFIQKGSPSEVLTKVNNRLSETSSSLFVTLSYMIFDTATKTVRYAIGGHMPTIMVDPQGQVHMLDVEEGMPLGMMETFFSEDARTYVPGCIFILYTDGVTEAMNTAGQMFGEDRLESLARSLRGLSADKAVKKIHDAVSGFAGRAKQHDDITVMVIRT